MTEESPPAGSFAAAMLREREAIVRWLRREMERNLWLSSAHACALGGAARAIERGEHLKPADEGPST